MHPLLETRTQSLNYADLPEARQVPDIGRFSAAQNPVRLSDGRFAESRSRFLIDATGSFSGSAVGLFAVSSTVNGAFRSSCRTPIDSTGSATLRVYSCSALLEAFVPPAPIGIPAQSRFSTVLRIFCY